MFNDSESFFYSEHGDLTNTLQRNKNRDEESKKLPLWKMVDMILSCDFFVIPLFQELLYLVIFCIVG